MNEIIMDILDVILELIMDIDIVKKMRMRKREKIRANRK